MTDPKTLSKLFEAALKEVDSEPASMRGPAQQPIRQAPLNKEAAPNEDSIKTSASASNDKASEAASEPAETD